MRACGPALYPGSSPRWLAKGIAIMPAVLDTAWLQRRGSGGRYRLSLKENAVMWGSQVPGLEMEPSPQGGIAAWGPQMLGGRGT